MSSYQHLKIQYRKLPIISAMLMFSACSLWLLFGPQTHGIVGEILGRNRTSLLAILAIVLSTVMAVIFVLHAFRALSGLPAIEDNGEVLSVYIFPFRKFKSSDISRIYADEKWLNIETFSGVRKRINLLMMDSAAARLDIYNE